jgi:hypothetical protein
VANTIMVVVAEPVKATMRVTAVERAEHRPAPGRVPDPDDRFLQATDPSCGWTAMREMAVACR